MRVLSHPRRKHYAFVHRGRQNHTRITLLPHQLTKSSMNRLYGFYFEIGIGREEDFLLQSSVLLLFWNSPDLRVLFICRPPGCFTDCPPNTDTDHERSSAGCVCAPPRPPLGLSHPGHHLPSPHPASRPGGPGRSLRRPPVWLGLHGHHLHPQAGGGTAVLQRFLGQRRTEGLQHRGALHVPDPHGDLRAGFGGSVPVVRLTVCCV